MWRWLIWITFVIAWTVALETPVPETPLPSGGDSFLDFKMLFAKTVHVSAYAFFAVLSGWMPAPARHRWILMFFLMLHAWGSEMLQDLLAPFFGRGGSLTDIAYDVVGIVIGVALSWKWWTRE